MNGAFPFPPVVRYLNAYTGVVLLRCRKDFYQLVWSALPFITYLENKGHRYPCFFNTLHVGGTSGVFVAVARWVGPPAIHREQDVPPTTHPKKGATVWQASCCPQKLFHVPGTIRTCQKFLIRYNRRQLLVLLQNCTDEGKQCPASVSRDRGSAGEMMPKAIFLSCRGAGSHQEVCLKKLSAGQRVGRRAF